jgi:hypothetical protein
MWPTLHVDDHASGVYEFGSVDGADAPVALNGAVASFPIWIVNHLRVDDQVAIYGDNSPEGAMVTGMTPFIIVKSVLSDGPGIILIHANENGTSGTILGAVFVNDGLTENLKIDLNYSPHAILTPVMWPMLHTDRGMVGKGEPSMDLVATADGRAVTFALNAAPSITVSNQTLNDSGDRGMGLIIKLAVIDAPGWIAIHSDDNGAPGSVIATALLHPGLNWNIYIPVDPTQVGGKVWPMLHYDTAAIGTYEFGIVTDADPPVFVQKNVVVVPLNIMQ